MDSFEDIKQVWLLEKAEDLPPFEEIQKAVSAYRMRTRKRLWLFIGLTVFCLFLMFFVLIFSEAKFLSTMIGEAFMIVSIIILLSSGINSLRRNSRNELASNQEFISKLKNDIKWLSYGGGTVQKISFSFITTGFLLFLYEAVYTNRLEMIGSYAIVMILLLLAWVFLRPFMNNEKLEQKEHLLKKLENLSGQIEE